LSFLQARLDQTLKESPSVGGCCLCALSCSPRGDSPPAPDRLTVFPGECFLRSPRVLCLFDSLLSSTFPRAQVCRALFFGWPILPFSALGVPPCNETPPPTEFIPVSPNGMSSCYPLFRSFGTTVTKSSPGPLSPCTFRTPRPSTFSVCLRGTMPLHPKEYTTTGSLPPGDIQKAFSFSPTHFESSVPFVWVKPRPDYYPLVDLSPIFYSPLYSAFLPQIYGLCLFD